MRSLDYNNIILIKLSVYSTDEGATFPEGCYVCTCFHNEAKVVLIIIVYAPTGHQQLGEAMQAMLFRK